MPYAQAGDVRLYYEETGTGYPIVFAHEYASDHREWEAQVRFFSRDYRCITYAARGYPPSDVPLDPELYGQDAARDDIAAVLGHLGLSRAHVVGLSMGAFATLRFGLRYPEMASALVVAGVGSGSDLGALEEWRRVQAEKADRLLEEGWATMADEVANGPTRIRLLRKDPRGWRDFLAHLKEHSGPGSSLTGRRYQGQRDSVYHWEEQLRHMQVPTLLAVGDEDEPCIEPTIFLKRTLPNAGLWMHPRTGHAINLEEPTAFNRAVSDFLGTVERGRWQLG